MPLVHIQSKPSPTASGKPCLLAGALMWMTWYKYRSSDQDLASSTMELMKNTLNTLMYTTAGLLVVWFFIAGVNQPELLNWRFWLVIGLLFFTVQYTPKLLKRSAIWASTLWLCGLFTVITLMIVLLDLPSAAFLYPVFPLLAISTIGWPAGFITEALVIGVTLFLGTTAHAEFIEPYRISLLIGSLATGLVGWIVANALMNEVRNTAFYYRQAREHMEEARAHRARALHILKDLDRAYYSLERANAAQVAAMRKAEEAERFKAEFVTYVSHEMRTPLNLILGFSETILTSPESYNSVPLAGVYREDLSKINRNAHHMLALINDVIDLSRADVNRIPLMREVVDVQTLIMETINMVRDYIQSKGLSLNVETKPGLGTITVDALRIRQVLLNLLVNAARFTEAGGIRLHVSKQDDHILFRIIDSGKGISPSELPHIFEEYHTSSQQTISWTGSSGLGLPISKALVELHDGQIGVNSEFSEGTEFWFTLPLHAEESAETTVGQYRFSQVEASLPTPVIVAVCDDRRVSDTLQRMMDKYRIVPAEHSEQALALAEEHQAVAVIVPECQGQRTCPEYTVIIECDLPGLKHIADELGVTAVMEKPVKPAELLDIVGQLDPSPRTVLIVDDDINVVDLFGRILKPKLPEARYLQAYGGEEALEILRAQTVDLVLLDLAMPDVGGKQVLYHIQSSTMYGDPKVIVISGTVQDTASMRIRDALRLSRIDGLTLGETARALQAVVAELNPSWMESG